MYIVFDNSEMSPLVPKPIVSRKAILEAFGNIFPVNLNIILIRNIVKNRLSKNTYGDFIYEMINTPITPAIVE